MLRDGSQSLLYCCHSLRTTDMAGNPHVLSVGIDLLPALRSHTPDADAFVEAITESCIRGRGEAEIPKPAAEAIRAVARVLNIAWVGDALLRPARIICPRSTHCPRTGHCAGGAAPGTREITDVREEIVRETRRDTQRRRG